MWHSGGSTAPLAQGTFQLFTEPMFKKREREKGEKKKQKKKKKQIQDLSREINETEFNISCRPYSKGPSSSDCCNFFKESTNSV